MEKSDIKTIKEVQGRKVIHPFMFGNIFYSLLLLILVAFPVGILFLPLINFPSTDPVISVNGLDLFKYFAIDYWMDPRPAYPDGMALLSLFAGNETMEMVFSYVMMGQAAIIAVMILMSLIGLIIFIVSVSKGYLRHPHAVKGIASFDFIFSIFFGLSFLFYFIMAAIGGAADQIFIWFSFIPMGAALVLLIIISIVYNHHYADCLYESDLVFNEDEDKEVVTTHVTEVHEVTKVKYEQPNTLPQDITSIGGHEFSANQNLQVANIPVGIVTIGNSAFANCLNLRVVSMPDSVKEIGYNCFYNCVSLERVNYAGTKEQWRHIKRGSNWLAKAKTTEVVCVDGPIIVNPYH